MKAIYIFLCLTWCICQKAYAENTDSVVFSKYVMNNIQPSPPLNSIQTVFNFWINQDKGENERLKSMPFLLRWVPDEYGHLIFTQREAEPAYKTALNDLRRLFDGRMTDSDSIAQEKHRLANSLTAMDSLLHNKPLLFQLIYKKYNGNISRYVDDLYSRSFMTSEKLFKRMMRRTRPKLLVKDLGVNYALSMALYQAWLKQQGEKTDRNRR